MNTNNTDRAKEFAVKFKALVEEYDVTVEIDTGWYGDVNGMDLCVDGKRAVGTYSTERQFTFWHGITEGY